jgi:hypothetical protein
MTYPPLVHYSDEKDYRAHYERVYCMCPICTFDGIRVRFRKEKFGHCFFKSMHRNGIKDSFSTSRAERIDWIKATLQDPNAELFEGWDKERKRYDATRRVALVMGNYVVIIRFTGSSSAEFVTAYLVDTDENLKKIKSSPRYSHKQKTADSPGGLSG